ncbi:MAG TPA: hypothetical protein VK603_11990 [Candidatus Saccharimonadales bacterium]|nr:hypothetical protein [Candidatus Saccharimonadales bacterium]
MSEAFVIRIAAVMDTLLRPYGLGSTQWSVLYQLANVGPTMQRDLVQVLNIERANSVVWLPRW